MRNLGTYPLGSTRALSNSSAPNITDSYSYSPFGNLVLQSGNTNNTYLYTGEQFDPELGSYYLRARYYNPTLGRFISRDKYEFDDLAYVSEINKYAYARLNPVNFTDPSGELAIAESSFLHARVAAANTAAIAAAGTAAACTFLITASAFSDKIIELEELLVGAGLDSTNLTGAILTGIIGKCQLHRMRAQLQFAKSGVTSLTLGQAAVNIPRSGVLTSQMLTILSYFRTAAVPWQRFPNSKLPWLQKCLDKAKSWVLSRPPFGVGPEFKRSIFTCNEYGYHGADNNRGEWRLDIDNLFGHNLRQ